MRAAALGVILLGVACAGCGTAPRPEPEQVTTIAVVPPSPASSIPPETPSTVSSEPLGPTQAEVSVTFQQQGNKLKSTTPVRFENGQVELRPDSEPVLQGLAAFLGDKPQITLLRIEGHTDSRGDSGRNLRLSGQRALKVVESLERLGVSHSRLVAVGFGDMKPVADNSTAEGREQNQRIEFIVVEVNGKPWLGADPAGGGTVFGRMPRP